MIFGQDSWCRKGRRKEGDGREVAMGLGLFSTVDELKAKFASPT